MRPPCTLYTAFCNEKIRAITRSTRFYISALEGKRVRVSYLHTHAQKGHDKTHISFSLFHTRNINTTKEWQPKLAIL